MHKSYANEVIAELKKPKPAENKEELYKEQLARANKLEKKTNKRLKRGIKTAVTFEPLSGGTGDGDIDFKVKIAPNDTVEEGSFGILEALEAGNHGSLAAEMEAVKSVISFEQLNSLISRWRDLFHDEYHFKRDLENPNSEYWQVKVYDFSLGPRGGEIQGRHIANLKLKRGGSSHEGISDTYFKKLKQAHAGDTDKLEDIGKAEKEFHTLKNFPSSSTLSELRSYNQRLNKLDHDLFLLGGGSELDLPSPKQGGRFSGGKALSRWIQNLSAKTPPGTEPVDNDVMGWKFIEGQLNKKLAPGGTEYKPSQKWVRMHIVNENFGGRGNAVNLVPGTKNNNYTHLKKFEEGIKDFIKKDATGNFKVAGMKGDIDYWPSGLYEADKTANPKHYHVPGAFYTEGIKSEMYARTMRFTSWAYKKTPEGWRQDTTAAAPSPELLIENELPNWQTPRIPSTGTVSQEDLAAMAWDSSPAGRLMLENKAKLPVIHHIFTRHNYGSIEEFRTRVEDFRLRKHGTAEEKAGLSKLPDYELSSRDFNELGDALEELIIKEKITIK